MRSVSSSIARKAFMGAAGLFLATFLLVHLGINLLLLYRDGGVAFSAAARFMVTNPVIKVMELVLFSAFFIHILLGFVTTAYNRKARPERYVVRNDSEAALFSKYMMHSGIIVLLFLSLHFLDFYLVKIGLVSPPEGIAREDLYRQALYLFSSPWYSLLYSGCMIVLGMHLHHAIQSALQTFGIQHAGFQQVLTITGILYAIVVAGGFALVPIALLIFR